MSKFIELPIQTDDVGCVTDCWIYNRLAIIKTSPFYSDWLASHYNLLSIEHNNIFFGDISLYPPSYHDSILLRKQLLLSQFTKANVIKQIKDHIENGYYVIMTLKQYSNRDFYHEVLIYGFDDNKSVLLTVALDKNKFKKLFLNYNYLESTIENIKDFFFTENFEKGMHLSLYYQYPVTALKLNPNYIPDNCVFEAYLKLQNEHCGDLLEVKTPDGFSEYKSSKLRLKGLSCLDAFKQTLEKKLNGENFEEWFRGIISAANKLREHHLMVLHSMEYIFKKWKVAFDNSAKIYIDQYKYCCKTIEKWVVLCIKFEVTKDARLLRHIIEEIPTIFTKEKEILGKFLYHSFDIKKFNYYYI